MDSASQAIVFEAERLFYKNIAMGEEDGIARAAGTFDGQSARAMHRLQREIRDREDEISRLVDAVERPVPLSGHMSAGDSRRRLAHLEGLISDWDTLVARSRAISEDDFGLIVPLAGLMASVLLEQTDDVSERWIDKLREYLDDQRAKVS